MNKNTRKNLGLGKDWDPWFNHSKSNIPAKEKRVKESYYFIFDCETNAPEYISKTVVDVLGYLPEEITMEKIFSCIHPDDLEYCNECEINYLKITDNLYFLVSTGIINFAVVVSIPMNLFGSGYVRVGRI